MTCPTTPAQWQQIAEEFYRKWNFPHACGALDGKHIAIRCPGGSGSTYFNYKKFYSIVLLALVDANYKFLWADVGRRGSASDAQIYNESELKEATEDGSIGLPDPEPLPYDNANVPYYWLADDVFGLRSTLMKPYSHRCMLREERIFNYRISRARRVVENAFGILANRFQVLLTTMNHQPSTVILIVKTCLVLHNLVRIRYPRLQNRLLDNEDRSHRLVPGEWRRGRNMEDVRYVQM